MTILAFDFGGTKLAAAFVETTRGEILHKLTIATPAEKGADACLQAMFDLGESLIGKFAEKPTAIGISYGGPVTPDQQRCVLSNHIPGWVDYPLVEKTRLHFNLPVSMDNDANAAALGSWVYDVNREPDHFMYVQASTGIGGGLVLNRHLFRGGSMAGEIGHTHVPGNPAKCVCGNFGCLETICAGWGIAERAAEYLNDGTNPTAEVVFASIRSGDAAYTTMIEEAFKAFGVNIANAVAVMDLQQVVFGGGIFRSQDIIAPVMLAAIEKATPSYMRGRCSYGFSTLNGIETLLGAALLTQEEML
ncbi:MAG: ROK family protein [Anaerolineae bacterium]|jgi:glucokinase|nr:ROK family protein [Anaerolineae bacterium]